MDSSTTWFLPIDCLITKVMRKEGEEELKDNGHASKSRMGHWLSPRLFAFPL